MHHSISAGDGTSPNRAERKQFFMRREDAKQEVKRQISCTRYLEKSQSGLYCCPFCGSGHGRKHTGAVKYYPDTNTISCFGNCALEAGTTGKIYDVIDLHMNETKTDYNTALQQLADEIGITIDPYRPTAAEDFAPTRRTEAAERPQTGERAAGGINAPAGDLRPQRGAQEAAERQQADYTAYYEACRERLNDPAAQRYLSLRGISTQTAAACMLGYDPQADPAGAPGATGSEYRAHPAPRIIIPTNKSHYVGRRIDGGKDFEKVNAKGSSPGIFNFDAIYAPDAQYVFITEGAFDALSIIEAGTPAIALNSANNRAELVRALEEKRPAAILVLSLDNDRAGRRAASELSDDLQRLNIAHIKANVCGAHKDPNEALKADRKAFEAAIEDAKQQGTKPDSVAYYMRHLMGDEIAKFKKDIKTGYANLDEKAGGLYSGLYVIAAISSLGKTTFAHQMGDQIAAGGTDVLFFSMEQSRLEMVTKSIARRTAQKDPGQAVTSLAIRKGYMPGSVINAAQEYENAVKDHISIIEGDFNCTIFFISDYIRQYMRRNKAAETGEKPVVIIDYLQILKPTEDERGRTKTVRETVDESVTELRKLCRELDIPIIVISSVNRANYLTPIDFESLKESGGIEYTADVVYGLQLQCLNDPIFDQQNKTKEKRETVRRAKAATPRKIELVCLKNRYGISSFSCYFNYYPAADLFTPCSEAEIDFSLPGAQPKANRKL